MGGDVFGGRVGTQGDAAAFDDLDCRKVAGAGLDDGAGGGVGGAEVEGGGGDELGLEALEALDSALFDLEGPTREMTLRGVNLFRMSARDMGARKAAKRLLKAHGVDVPSY